MSTVPASNPITHKPGLKKEVLSEIYTNWANDSEYDKDLSPVYRGPSITADLMVEMFPDVNSRKDIYIIDVAAGSGFVAEKLREKGFEKFDALDPSEGMLKLANEKGLYIRSYLAYLDENRTEIESDFYDVAVVCGGFGENHIPCSGLNELIRIVKPGGLIVIAMSEVFLNTVQEYKDRLEPRMKDLELAGQWTAVRRQSNDGSSGTKQTFENPTCSPSAFQSKDLVLDSDLTKPLDRVAGISFLKEHGVDRIFYLERGKKTLPGCGKRIYLVRPRLVTMKYIADQINCELSNGDKRSYKVIFVPRKTHVCEKILESEGVMGYVTLDEFSLELFPLDKDLLSLELPELFTSFFLDNDTTWLHTVASSLANLQRLFGKIPNIFTLGKGSKMVFELMNSMNEKHEDRKETKSQIGQMFIIDRDIDYITPMCTPMTYEALLDETFGIECSVVTLKIKKEEKVTKLLLTSQEEIYTQIRDRHFSNVFSYLGEKAKELQILYNKKNDVKTVGDMREFVNKELRQLKHQQKLLEHHITACEDIMETKGKENFEELIRTEQNMLDGTETKENLLYIEESIQKQSPMLQSLRLLCLMSLTQEGLTPRDYKTFKTGFLQSHGFEHLVTFFNLKKLGMLTEQETSVVSPLNLRAPAFVRKSNYRFLNQKLGLVPKLAEELDLRSPKDMSYIYSGAYSPLSCKLVEKILTRDSLVGFEDVGKVCGGIHSEIKVRNRSLGTVKSAPGNSDPSMKVILVYFLGGCTYSEITALRFLAKQLAIRIIVATTAIINSNSLLDRVVEKITR